MCKQLLVGTHNPSRIELVRAILKGYPVDIRTLEDLGIHQEVAEDGRSTEENAVQKARAYYALSHLSTLAMDGGLYIDRFPPDRQPGVLVRRPGGLAPTTTSDEIMAYYLRELARVGGESPGTWTGSHALALSQERVIVAIFTFKVWFTANTRGQPLPGLALDPLMIDPESGKYYTEMALEELPYYHPVAEFIKRFIDKV